jgi:hypothetical protein
MKRHLSFQQSPVFPVVSWPAETVSSTDHTQHWKSSTMPGTVEAYEKRFTGVISFSIVPPVDFFTV